MPIFELPEAHAFPPPHLADADGLLAVGGDLTADRLLMAYKMGIFPWFSNEDPILWWSPDPRLVLNPEHLIVSRSLEKIIRKERFKVTMDTNFEAVIRGCSSLVNRRDDDTWIVPEMIDAYCELYSRGYAHSVEAWLDGRLAGGLYGISLGNAFFGESMFTRESNASKVAFVSLVRFLKKKGFDIVDCQVPTGHLKSLGACEITRSCFLDRLGKSLENPSKIGRWSF